MNEHFIYSKLLDYIKYICVFLQLNLLWFLLTTRISFKLFLSVTVIDTFSTLNNR